MGWLFTQEKQSAEELIIVVEMIIILIVYIILVILIWGIVGSITNYFKTMVLLRKIDCETKAINKGWKDIYIDKRIKKQLLDNVTRPLSIRQRSPIANLPKEAALPKGVLLSGDSGMGKTLLAMVVAKESKAKFISVAATDFRNCYYGESERKVKEIFQLATLCQPCILFIDEIDTIMSKRTEQKGWDVENSIKGVFLTCWDGISTKNAGNSSSVVLIGATNRPKCLDPAFLRRLDLNIEIGAPDVDNREKILEILLKESLLENGFSIKKIAEQTVGFSGSDLKEAVRYATMDCSSRYHKKLEKEINIDKLVKKIPSSPPSDSDWSLCLPSVPFFQKRYSQFPIPPKISKELAPIVPPKIELTMASMQNSVLHSKTSRTGGGGVGGLNEREMLIISNLIYPCDIQTTWQDIGGCEKIIQTIKDNVILPIKLKRDKKIKTSKNLQCPKGILLHGPPGTGKTLLAKAVARHAGCTFINLQTSMLESQYYGETSQRIAALFSVAEKYQPCIIFMDEIDGFLRSRGSNDSEHAANIKGQFLQLLDGVLTDPSKVIILMGATNRKEDLDAALLRRLTLHFEVLTPDRQKRVAILKLMLIEETLADDVCLEKLADATEKMTGADLKDVLRAAVIESVKEYYHLSNKDTDFLASIESITEQNNNNVKSQKDAIICTVADNDGAQKNNNNIDNVKSQTKFSSKDYMHGGSETKKVSSNHTSKPTTIWGLIKEIRSEKSIASLRTQCSDMSLSEDEGPTETITIKMKHFTTAIENFKTSRSNTGEVPEHLYI